MTLGNCDGLTAREHAMIIGERHVDSEYSNDIEQILPTVSTKDSFFPIVARKPDGEFFVQMYDGPCSARPFYAKRATEIDLEASDNLTLLVGDWWTARHSIGTVTLKEGLGAQRAGKRMTAPTVIAFPVAQDGLIGELAWNPYGVDEAIALTETGSTLPEEHQDPVATTTYVGKFVEAWQQADAPALDGLLNDQCFRIAKVVDADYKLLSLVSTTVRDEVLKSLAAGPPGHAQVISRHITAWFAIVEYRTILPAGSSAQYRRSICVYALQAGQVLGEISYAIES
jgi:hypothetical protein